MTELIAPFQEGFAAWRRVAPVVIAAVQGHAIGAGFQLALAADLRLRGTLTGVQAVAALRQAWAAAPHEVPALVITGDVLPERLRLLRDSGLPWLPKPVMPMRLRSWLAAQRDG